MTASSGTPGSRCNPTVRAQWEFCPARSIDQVGEYIGSHPVDSLLWRLCIPARQRQLIPAISLFSGAGGMDLGFIREGFDVRVAVELDPAACDTLRRNFRHLRGERLICRRLEDISTEEILGVANLEPSEAGIVFGGPPCQSFCVAGNRRGLRDPRGRSLLEFLRVVREARPSTFCIENVPGLLSHSEFEALSLIGVEVNRGLQLQYSVRANVLNSAEYGVPQYRRRVFLVGWRGPGEFYFPAATHQVNRAPQRATKRPATTVGKAFEGLPDATPPSDFAHRIAATIPLRNQRWYSKR
jgi:DNA (cytosine-5)-methyltransferase 1